MRGMVLTAQASLSKLGPSSRSRRCGHARAFVPRRVMIGSLFDFEQGRNAMMPMESGAHFGKSLSGSEKPTCYGIYMVFRDPYRHVVPRRPRAA